MMAIAGDDDNLALRPDLLEKVTGRAAYIGDIRVEGMAHGQILRSPLPHALILGINFSVALAQDGVIDVLTGKDLSVLVEKAAWGLYFNDRPVIAQDRVRYVGEPVAVVVAETPEIAENALNLIEVDYEALPAVHTAEVAIAPGAPIINENVERIADFYFTGQANPVAGTNIFQKYSVREGDVEGAEGTAVRIFEHTYRFPGISHFALEPHCVIAKFDNGELTVWSGAQSPTAVQKVLSRVFGFDLTNVRVIVPYVGGGFGGKASVKIEPLVAAAARKAGRPVRIALSLDESMLTCRRLGATITLRTAVDENGRIISKKARIVLDGGAYADTGPAVTVKAAHRVIGPYAIENLDIEAIGVYTNTIPGSAFRSIGGPQAVWATESQMDEIAEALGIDALEFRQRNLLDRGGSILEKLRPLDVDFAAMIARAETAFGELGGGAESGMALAATDPGILALGGASIRILADGSTVIASNSVEMGQGVRGVLRGVAARVLNQKPDAIRVADPDTAKAPFDWGTGASRSTIIMGLAVEDAACDARKQILELAAAVFDGNPNDIELVPGGAAHGNETLSFHELYHRAFGIDSGEVVGQAMVRPSRGDGDFKISPLFWETSVGMCDVDLDEETGEVSLKTYVGVADIGKALNPVSAEGQEEGASVQGIGHALFEQLRFEDGQPVTATPIAYSVPRAGDVAAQAHTILIENEDGPGPSGAKGMGEGGILPVAPAIANALARRYGVRVRDLPITPEAVWRALKNRSFDAS
ncbi:MAG: xanthine dehydrogenase family protein molybdopterin-binding subunit [Alphaproteobacteria bacterium]